jgi:hypothetical protein
MDETAPPPAPPQKPKRHRLRYDKATYDAVLDAYRQAGHNHVKASALCGVHRAACANFYENGFKSRKWARPIKEVLAEEAADARTQATLRAEEERQRERDLLDAERIRRKKLLNLTLEEEAAMMAAIRKNVTGVMAIANHMQPAMLRVAKVVMSAVVDDQGKPLAVPLVNPLQAMKLLRDYAAIVNRGALAADIVRADGRLERDGKPEEVATEGEMDDAALLEGLELVAGVRDTMKAKLAAEPGEPTVPDPNELH